MNISRVRATGSYLPEREVLNQDLKQFPASSLPLIEQKTGIAARRYAGEDESTSDLAAQAANVWPRGLWHREQSLFRFRRFVRLFNY